MLPKPAAVLSGLICEKPLSAHKIIRQLNYMNVKRRFIIAGSELTADWFIF